jgi:hypothetical protein
MLNARPLAAVRASTRRTGRSPPLRSGSGEREDPDRSGEVDAGQRGGGEECRGGHEREVECEAAQGEARLRSAKELLRPGDAEQQRSHERHGDAERGDHGGHEVRGRG